MIRVKLLVASLTLLLVLSPVSEVRADDVSVLATVIPVGTDGNPAKLGVTLSGSASQVTVTSVTPIEGGLKIHIKVKNILSAITITAFTSSSVKIQRLSDPTLYHGESTGDEAVTVPAGQEVEGDVTIIFQVGDAPYNGHEDSLPWYIYVFLDKTVPNYGVWVWMGTD